jgi:hypothetical protein
VTSVTTRVKSEAREHSLAVLSVEAVDVVSMFSDDPKRERKHLHVVPQRAA